MAQDRFLVGPYKTGWETDVDPWLLPEDGYNDLRNAFIYEGRVHKRVGGKVLNPDVLDPELFTRLRINLGNTDAAGNLAAVVPGVASGVVGQAFSVASEVFTVNVLGAPAVMLTTGAATTHTYNTGTGAFDIQGAAVTTALYFYPAQPVMGFGIYEQGAINSERTMGFDRQFAYQWVGGEWVRAATGNDVWTGTNTDFFWSISARGATFAINNLYATNFTIADRIRYWNGATWVILDPIYGAGGNDHVVTAKLIMFFKDRLLLLNTIEVTGTNTRFPNRLRFSQLGDPQNAQAFRTDISGRGNYVDAPTTESIVSVEFIKDRLIVYFERSTYELVYTGNQVLPFRFQKLNRELGVESTFSVVPFDKGVLGIGNVGIHACNGVTVERIDRIIKDEVFDISNDNDGHIRVQGIRDYFVETVYWTYPSVEQQSGSFNNTFPNRMFVYDYTMGSWSYNDDSITALGYLQNLTSLTWSGADMPWREADFPWATEADDIFFRNVLAGNQEGFTFLIDRDTPRNSPALQITNLTIGAGAVITITAINHNLNVGQYIFIENVQGTTNINGRIFRVTPTNANVFSFPDDAGTIVGTYTGGGTIALVTPLRIDTKDYNFYLKQGYNVALERIDFFVDRTDSGEITVDYFTSTSNLSLLTEATNSNTIVGTSILETRAYLIVPYESTMDQFWHTLYFFANGQFVQLRFRLTHEQITDPAISHSDFVLNAVIYHTSPTDMRLQG